MHTDILIYGQGQIFDTHGVKKNTNAGKQNNKINKSNIHRHMFIREGGMAIEVTFILNMSSKEFWPHLDSRNFGSLSNNDITIQINSNYFSSIGIQFKFYNMNLLKRVLLW